MYKTLLQTQLLGVENPHLVEGGALNDDRAFSGESDVKMPP